MTDSFVFYRSYYEAISDLNNADKLTMFEAIAELSLNDKEPQLNGIMATMFKLIRPQIDSNKKKRKDGMGGGRPPKKTNGLQKEKPVVIEKKNQWLSDEKPNGDVNGDVNDNEDKKIKAERFENFWKFYNKGSKKNAKTQFMKLSLEDIDKMSFHVVKYFKANPEKKYRKDAERYISHRLFETEIDLPKETLPDNWWNMDLTPEQWKLVPEDKVQEKKRHDIRRQMGI